MAFGVVDVAAEPLRATEPWERGAERSFPQVFVGAKSLGGEERSDLWRYDLYLFKEAIYIHLILYIVISLYN